MSIISLCFCVWHAGWIVTELAVAKQRCRHLLHPHHRPRSVHDRRLHRIFHKVSVRRTPTAGMHTRQSEYKSVLIIFIQPSLADQHFDTDEKMK